MYAIRSYYAAGQMPEMRVRTRTAPLKDHRIPPVRGRLEQGQAPGTQGQKTLRYKGTQIRVP